MPIGKIIPAKIPICKLPPNISETQPAMPGPILQPKSPPNAKKANMAVPPPYMVFAERDNVPGHKSAEAIPHMAQPARLITGFSKRAIIR